VLDGKSFFLILGILLDGLITLLFALVLFRAFLSWFSPDPENPLVKILQRITEPLLKPLRKISPFSKFGLDFAPLFFVLLVFLLRFFLLRPIFDLSVRGI
jgi:YggT family protein